jgi:uncharacterized protein (DUF3820 family)
MTLTDESPMPFGKYKGTEMVNVPASYLIWLYDQRPGMKPWGEEAEAVRNYTIENYDALKKELEE